MKVSILCKSTCSTCRSARRFLAEHLIDHQWRWTDKDPLSAEELKQIFRRHALMAVLNPRSTPWRRLKLNEDQLTIDNSIEYVLQDVNLLRRPLMWIDGELHTGFKESVWSNLLL